MEQWRRESFWQCETPGEDKPDLGILSTGVVVGRRGSKGKVKMSLFRWSQGKKPLLTSMAPKSPPLRVTSVCLGLVTQSKMTYEGRSCT